MTPLPSIDNWQATVLPPRNRPCSFPPNRKLPRSYRTVQREIERAQFVADERVRAALKHDRVRPIALHHAREDL